MAVNDYHCHQETFLSEFAAIVDQHEPTPEGNLILIHLIYLLKKSEWRQLELQFDFCCWIDTCGYSLNSSL
jgi:hypothetical protein